MSKRLDGITLLGMLKNGYANVYLHEKEINDLNVFPVADGDTGVNMRLTLENGLASTSESPHIGKLITDFGNGVLFGARGNSGVILSQLIKGWAIVLEGCSVAGVGELRDALISGYKQAYSSVAHPVEGTVLTVAREGIENIRRRINRATTVEELFSNYITEMRRVLEKTPEMLDVLKKANVVDSGAVGYIYMIEGMYKYLFGQTLEPPADNGETDARTDKSPYLFDGFDENSSFELGYCTEFVLQLLKAPSYRQDFSAESLRTFLDSVGESTVLVHEDNRVKVHVHTKSPEKIIGYVRQFGELLSIHIDNMQVQHNGRPGSDTANTDSVDGATKPLAIISVANGRPLCDTLETLGCDRVIDVGPAMNVSPSEFIRALDGIDAQTVVILPNNKNTVGPARLAASLYRGSSRVTVIPTSSVIEGYCAIAMDIRDESDADRRIAQMKSGADGVHTLTVATAARDYTDGTVNARRGQYIALIDDNVVASCDKITDAVLSGLSLHPDIDEKNICLIINGEDTADILSDVEDAVSDRFPDLEVDSTYGGQSIHKFIIGLI